MPEMPIYKIVRRTLWERLFTFPWRPLQATRQERDWKAELAHPRYARPQIQRPAPDQPAHLRSVVRQPLRPVPPQSAVRRECDAPPRPVDDGVSLFYGGAPFARANTQIREDLSEPIKSGGGGEFSGAGASGNWNDTSSSSSDSGSSSSDGGSSSSGD